MTQLISPFVEGKYGWSFGESGWNSGMDENLLKFSFLFDKNIDGIVSSLPAAVSGSSYFLTTDNRVYFVVGSVYYSTPIPKWFVINLKSNGTTYQFNGTALVLLPSPNSLVKSVAGRVGDVILSKSDVGLTNVDNTSDANKPISNAVLKELLPNVRMYGAVGDGVTDDSAAFQSAYAANQRVRIPGGYNFLITQQIGSLTDGKGIVWQGDGGNDSIITLQGNGGFLVSGKGWEVGGITFNPKGIVPFAVKTGTISDNHGSSFHDNIVQSNTGTDYFSTVLDCNSMWYSKIYNNFIYNGRVNTDFNGNGIQLSYSVNNSIYGNTIGCCQNAIICTATTNPVNGNVCEGIFVEDNILIANKTHFTALAGLYFSVDANMIDLTPAAFNPIYTDQASCVQISNNWISGGGPIIIRYGDRNRVAGNTFSSSGVSATFESNRYSSFIDNNIFSGTQGITFNTGGSGCSGWIITNNQFTVQTVRAMDCTNLSDSQVSNNRQNGVAGASLYSSTIYTSADEFVTSSVVSVTAGGPSFAFTVNLPAGRFATTPTIAELSVQSGNEPLLYTYNVASSNTSTLSFTVYPRSGNILGGNIRFGVNVKR